MSESIIILSTGERVRVEAEYEQLKEWHLSGSAVDLQTRGTYPGDPPMLIAFGFVMAIMPAECNDCATVRYHEPTEMCVR